MIAACPTCGARYRIDTEKLRPEGARLRCSRCESVFRVRAPTSGETADASPAAAAQPPQPSVEPAPQPSVQPAPQPARPPSEARPEPAAPPQAAPVAEQATPTDDGSGADTDPAERERLVLVAHPEPESGKAVADALVSWGLRATLVHDGVEAILNIQRSLPRVVVLDAALPKMFGFQVCELVKRNESLRKIHVILIGAIHDRDRYRRPPGELYGADAYVEPQNLPEGLSNLLERFGLPIGSGAPAKAAPAAQPAAEPIAPQGPQPAPPQAAPEPAPVQTPDAPADPALAAEIEQADRLARIIVSDIILYNPDKFEAGLRSGDVVGALCNELEEGHALFAQRVDPRVGDPDQFLRRELVRVARSRGLEA